MPHLLDLSETLCNNFVIKQKNKSVLSPFWKMNSPVLCRRLDFLTFPPSFQAIYFSPMAPYLYTQIQRSFLTLYLTHLLMSRGKLKEVLAFFWNIANLITWDNFLNNKRLDAVILMNFPVNDRYRKHEEHIFFLWLFSQCWHQIQGLT